MKHPSILGAICGDVTGSIFEIPLFSTKSYDFHFFTPTSCATDDSVLTVAVADWLLHDDSHSAHNLTDTIVRYARKYPNAGYGGSFFKWMMDNDHAPYNSWGNGSAMRISPIAFYFDSMTEVLEMAKLSAAITHNHPEGIKGAQATAAAIFMARTGESKDEIRDYIERKFGYDLKRKLTDIRPTYQFDVSCQGSVPESIICFLESKNYEDCIRLAISLGGDADTMAAIAGGIAAAYYKEIPDNIVKFALERLPEEMKKVVDEFNERCSSKRY